MPKGDGRSFTDPFLRNVGSGEYFDAKTQGLGIRVSPTGRKTWFFRYQTAGGRRRREKLGVYPDLSLGMARRRARIRLGEVSGETDRWNPRKDLLFEEAATEALDLMATRTRERTVQERQRIYEKDLLPRWGDRLVSDIRRKDVSALVREIAGRGSPVMANRTLSMVRALFNAMLDLELVEANPATRPDRFYQEEGPRERDLPRTELKAILRAMGKEGPDARAFSYLVIYTGQRAGAVAGARWSEFDLERGTWTIPPEEGKKFKGYARRIPLNEGALQALRILGETRGAGIYLFPARKHTKGDHWSNWQGVTQRLRKASGVGGWTFHDLRTAFRSTAVDALGISPEVADLVLGHAVEGVGFTHYQSDKVNYLLPEKRDALEVWGEYLDGLHPRPAMASPEDS